MNDDQLNRIFAQSRPPAPSPALDERVLDSYRKITRTPLLVRFLRARLSIPVPAVLVCAAMFGSIALWRFPQPAVMPPPRVSAPAPVPAPIREVGACPEPSQRAKAVRRKVSVLEGNRPRALTTLAWTAESSPEWRIVQ